MSGTTIEARLVAEGVGLPRYWNDKQLGRVIGAIWWEFPSNKQCRDSTLDLSDPQTAFGVALRLDQWERAGGRDTRWIVRIAEGLASIVPDPGPLQALAARLTEIAHDHAIRRALGDSPQAHPGWLAKMRIHPTRGYWEMGLRTDYPGDQWRTSFGLAIEGRWQPLVEHPGDYLAGITDPALALAAIRAEVAP